MRSRAAWCCLAVLFALPALASPKEDLEKTRRDMEQSKARQARLTAQTQVLEAELKELQEKLVRSADSVQERESDLTRSEDKLRILNEQMQAKSTLLKNRQKELSTLVQAALRLSRTPPEAMVMMPGDVTQTMKAARALKMASDSIRQETESIGLQMAELQKLKQKVIKKRDELGEKQVGLEEDRQSLAEKLAERQKLREKLGQQQEEETQRLAQLAKKARDLEDLLSSLTRDAARETQGLRPDEQAPQGRKGKLRSFVAAKGQIRPPAAGQVVQLFGAREGRDSTSKGVVIVTRRSAQVTAPYDAEVLFTGPFLDYGRLVILRHSDDFHTLLVGLTKIDVAAGQFLLEGEPIGAMGDSESGSRLYVELRKNNQPVDPAPWIRGLKKKNQE